MGSYVEPIIQVNWRHFIHVRVPWKEELYRVLEENHEGACGNYFALKTTLHKILQEGYVWPSVQKDVHHWCSSCKR